MANLLLASVNFKPGLIIKTYYICLVKNNSLLFQNYVSDVNQSCSVLAIGLHILFQTLDLNLAYNIRVATVREKCLENEIISMSGKSQGILWMVREI